MKFKPGDEVEVVDVDIGHPISMGPEHGVCRWKNLYLGWRFVIVNDDTPASGCWDNARHAGRTYRVQPLDMGMPEQQMAGVTGVPEECLMLISEAAKVEREEMQMESLRLQFSIGEVLLRAMR